MIIHSELDRPLSPTSVMIKLIVVCLEIIYILRGPKKVRINNNNNMFAVMNINIFTHSTFNQRQSRTIQTRILDNGKNNGKTQDTLK